MHYFLTLQKLKLNKKIGKTKNSKIGKNDSCTITIGEYFVTTGKIMMENKKWLQAVETK
jgi:hypothetical protein